MVTPSFSIGTSSISPTTTARRSTRRAAMVATTRIAEELAPQRRSTRLATRGGSGAATTTTSSSAASTRSATAVPRGRTALPPVPKASPIVLDDDDEDDDMESMNLKPAAKVPVAEVAAALSALADFTCAICLDAPPAMSDVASISGCTHRFCFDCIDQWANTENRCPCCKARFRTIDRVVALPSNPVEIEAVEGTSSRKGKRKRSSNSTSSSPNSRLRSGGSTSSANSPNRRPNSRTVEDRNQQPMGIVIDAAFVQQILSSFMSATGGGRGSASGRAAAGGVGTAPGQVTFGTSEDGRPVIRVINPQGGGMVGVMEMYLSEGGAPAPVGGGGSGATAAAGSGSTRVAVRISRPATTTTTTTTTTSSDPSRRFAGFGAAAANGRTMRPVTAEFMQQLAAGSSRSAARGSEATASPAAAAAGSNSAASSRSVRFASNTGEGTDRVSSMARAHHQATSAIANLFVNHGVSGAGVSASSPRGRRGAFSVGGPSSSTSSNNGAAAAAAGAPSASDGTSRQVMTIRIITRPMNASQSTSHSPAVRSNNRRGAASSPSDSGSSDDEPIIID
jgi:hypothetical protein